MFTPNRNKVSESLNKIELDKMSKSIQKFERYKVMNKDDDLLSEVAFPKIQEKQIFGIDHKNLQNERKKFYKSMKGNKCIVLPSD